MLAKSKRKIDALLNMTNPFIISENNIYSLKQTHNYYFQVQMETKLLKLNSCYFYIWSKEQSITMEIFRDDVFWQNNNEKA